MYWKDGIESQSHISPMMLTGVESLLLLSNATQIRKMH